MAPTSSAEVVISVGFAPPALPVYEQPICPGDGYIWTPGYWAWDADFDDYYWVPGTWILAPEVGYLWTPPWWGWANGAWLWHGGYWGPHIGFYGGINYGFGYFGVGFVGGRWDHDHFFYNRSVTNINVVNIHNVYEERVTNVTVNHVSFNGGPGGVEARATAGEEAAARDRHIDAVAAQNAHIQAARGNPELRASANHGRPAIAATARPGEFSGREAVAAKEAGGTYNRPENRGAAAPRGGAANAGGNYTHAKELPAYEKVTPNTGNPKQDQKLQQQQEKLASQQAKEQQKLAQQQEKEHQQAAKQNANEARQQQMEQRHQQQTQQLQQKHTQQRQQLQQKMQPASRPSGGGERKK